MARSEHGRPPAAAQRRQALVVLVRSALISAALVVLYFVLPMDQTAGIGSAAELSAGLVGVCALVGYQTVSITRARYPRLRAVEAFSTTLVLFLVMFSSAYYLLEDGAPGSFSEHLTRLDALYFTVTVFATVGFGDITARTEAARIVTTVQMVADVILVGVAARVVLGAVRVGLRRRADEDGPGE